MSPSLSSKFFPFFDAESLSVRRLVALALRAASRHLARWSRQVAATERRRVARVAPGVFEFYAEAGAAEGALYVDGQLIGYLPGVNRL